MVWFRPLVHHLLPRTHLVDLFVGSPTLEHSCQAASSPETTGAWNCPKGPWTLLRRGRTLYNKGLYPNQTLVLFRVRILRVEGFRNSFGRFRHYSGDLQHIPRSLRWTVSEGCFDLLGSSYFSPQNPGVVLPSPLGFACGRSLSPPDVSGSESQTPSTRLSGPPRHVRGTDGRNELLFLARPRPSPEDDAGTTSAFEGPSRWDEKPILSFKEQR